MKVEESHNNASRLANLQIDLKTAKQLYPTADKYWKEVFEKTFGAAVFKKITERVKSYEDALEVLGRTPSNLSNVLHIAAYEKLTTIIEALNEGWFPNWDNGNEAKFYPYFDMKNGSQLYYILSYYQYSSVSSRFFFKNFELAEYAVKQFIDLYKQFYL